MEEWEQHSRPQFDAGIKCINCVILLSPELCISPRLRQENIMGPLLNHFPVLQNYYLRIDLARHRVRYCNIIKGIGKDKGIVGYG